MWKKFSVLLALCMWLGVTFAAVDANKATAQELTQVKGIGEATAERIVQERSSGAFRDWGDLIGRVKGIGASKAKSLSDGGLTVEGVSYTSSTTDTKKESDVKKEVKDKK
ncbi:hypothetical protein E9531_11075 [Lampropedia puyangensis]|uniref:Helix-hairpin-helix DNA-binding motif class 1 domain-containing protein n=1 Tax=Lampropedia puyangensis TaxID=1330072 RepID=A0A4S8F0A4_9BURK|nr:helix-hairpin-helix domain-containing protein [Lampropedia puyangensis]THU00299.1 hypothetical protein E9531_11075 [Lampropedia puyangensis]